MKRLGLLWLFARSRWLEQQLNGLIERALDRWTRLRIRDYVNLLHLRGDYKLSELHVDPGDWLADLNLAREGVHILGITRQDGCYIGAPAAETKINAGDRLLIYGRTEVLDELDVRVAGVLGEQQHRASVAREEQRRRQENANASS